MQSYHSNQSEQRFTSNVIKFFALFCFAYCTGKERKNNNWCADREMATTSNYTGPIKKQKYKKKQNSKKKH